MGFQFRKRVRLGKGLWINLGKRGASFSVGRGMFGYNTGQVLRWDDGGQKSAGCGGCLICIAIVSLAVWGVVKFGSGAKSKIHTERNVNAVGADLPAPRQGSANVAEGADNRRASNPGPIHVEAASNSGDGDRLENVPPKTDAVDDNAERSAQALLRSAETFRREGKTEGYKRTLQRVVEKYPRTKAAVEAAGRLGALK
jgi:hypothetical protein